MLPPQKEFFTPKISMKRVETFIEITNRFSRKNVFYKILLSQCFAIAMIVKFHYPDNQIIRYEATIN